MIYEYICNYCKTKTEMNRPIEDRNDPFPCDCGQGMMERVEISRSSFVLKGSGWAKDSYS